MPRRTTLIVALTLLLAACSGGGSNTGTGEIVFGTGLDANNEVTGQTDIFGVNDLIAYRASFSESAGSTSIDFILARVTNGTETAVFTQAITVPDPDSNFASEANSSLATLAGNTPGTYVMRLYRGSTKLAEGTFTLE
jgi:hypothetical protein